MEGRVGISERAHLLMAYHRVHSVETRIVRIFNTYGPRMRVNDGRAIPAFMSQALAGEDDLVERWGGADAPPAAPARVLALVLSDVVGAGSQKPHGRALVVVAHGQGVADLLESDRVSFSVNASVRSSAM